MKRFTLILIAAGFIIGQLSAQEPQHNQIQVPTQNQMKEQNKVQTQSQVKAQNQTQDQAKTQNQNQIATQRQTQSQVGDPSLYQHRYQFRDVNGNGIDDGLEYQMMYQKKNSYGPGDGTGNSGVGPQNGSGYGPGAGIGNVGVCPQSGTGYGPGSTRGMGTNRDFKGNMNQNAGKR